MWSFRFLFDKQTENGANWNFHSCKLHKVLNSTKIFKFFHLTSFFISEKVSITRLCCFDSVPLWHSWGQRHSTASVFVDLQHRFNHSSTLTLHFIHFSQNWCRSKFDEFRNNISQEMFLFTKENIYLKKSLPRIYESWKEFIMTNFSYVLQAAIKRKTFIMTCLTFFALHGHVQLGLARLTYFSFTFCVQEFGIE